MDLGDIVVSDGQRFFVRGLDPFGVRPRYVYLENVRTGKAVSVAFGRHFADTPTSQRRLRLVRERADESLEHGDQVRGAIELHLAATLKGSYQASRELQPDRKPLMVHDVGQLAERRRWRHGVSTQPRRDYSDGARRL